MPIVEPKPPYLSLPEVRLKTTCFLQEQFDLSADKKWVFVHSGTGGSATSLSLTQYAQLIQGLLNEFNCQIILTAGPGESEKAHEVAAKIDQPNVVDVR